MHFELLPLLQILGAGLLAGIVALERQLSDEAAGLRTDLLVGVGACLFALVSVYGLGFLLPGSPDMRIAANIATGVGFLGDRGDSPFGPSVRGLATAASLWLVAGVGVGIGSQDSLSRLNRLDRAWHPSPQAASPLVPSPMGLPALLLLVEEAQTAGVSSTVLVAPDRPVLITGKLARPSARA